LLVQSPSLVNTTTAGQQVLRSVGAPANGGYTVAWISDNAQLFMQRYDNSGNKSGQETAIALSVVAEPGECPSLTPDPAAVMRNASVAVLADGSVVVGYELDKPAPTVGSFCQANEGIYIQRFDANGVQVLPETLVFSRIAAFTDRNHPFMAGPIVVPLSDGGFVVGWDAATGSSFGLAATYSTQRYNSQAQPVGAISSPGFVRSPSAAFSLAPDASGGYTLTFPSLDANGQSVVSAIHYDATGTGTTIVASRPGAGLLLPLKGGGFVLFTSESSGAFRQFLDSAGNPVGEPTGIASPPVTAAELSDGSFVVFTQAAGGGFTAQRFDAGGAALGDPVAVDAIVSTAGVAALTDRSLGLAWTATPAGGDADVFTQRVLAQD
jgi:hypothetical protein